MRKCISEIVEENKEWKENIFYSDSEDHADYERDDNCSEEDDEDEFDQHYKSINCS